MQTEMDSVMFNLSKQECWFRYVLAGKVAKILLPGHVSLQQTLNPAPSSLCRLWILCVVLGLSYMDCA